jgi:methylenetetrahydrofolate dehydrogenase (NADP+)/methenyltetrahydrofolate cyclohydrolase
MFRCQRWKTESKRRSEVRLTLAPEYLMPAQRLDGRTLAARLEGLLAKAIRDGLPLAGRPPGLAVLRVGDDPASGVYVANKEKACSRVGLVSHGAHLSGDTPQQELETALQRLNDNSAVDGILVQLPVPDGIDDQALLQVLDPDKDADGLHPLNLGRLVRSEPGPRSCTPAGVMALLREAQVDLSGSRAVVIGRSTLVGQPMALMLQKADATVTVAHSRTRDLAALTRQADVLVVAAGRPGLIGAEHVSPGAVVVDVGIHRKPEGGLCGDVRSAEVSEIAAALTPVPGGVGPMTVTMLLVNAVRAWTRRYGLPDPCPGL